MLRPLIREVAFLELRTEQQLPVDEAAHLAARIATEAARRALPSRARAAFDALDTPRSARQVAAILDLKPSAADNILRRLVRDDLAIRTKDRVDGRLSWVYARASSNSATASARPALEQPGEINEGGL